MLSEKEMKKRVKDQASADPDRFYPTEKMREIGLIRSTCGKCGTSFWSADPDRSVCGEPACIGGYQFIGGKNCTHVMDFIGVWKRFSDLFEKRGYTPIKRYPSISRWNPTSDFTLASITDFQPYVVRGAVKPPANPLVVPQTCMRFNDVDNVGITGRHNTGFIMIGQHAFVPEEEFDQARYFDDIHAWLIEGMGIPLEDIVYHEDAWAGGGNFGCSLEFFSKGLEIGNQVYTMYEREGDELKGLGIRVLDMGMGQERPAWFSHGTPTSYEPNFPTVMKRLFHIAGIQNDGEEKDMMAAFLPYSGLLNMEEVDDIGSVWTDIAARLGVDLPLLKKSVMSHAGLYSIADHSRTLLFALGDGGLPSNSGGGYNLRLIYRRAMDFIQTNGWDIDIGDVCHWHARYLVPQYPEMLGSIDEVRQILDHERKKYFSNKEKATSTVERLKRKEGQGREITMDDMLKLYDSQGITPDLLKASGLDLEVPPDFYKRVTELHADSGAKARTGKDLKIELGEHPETGILYFDDYLDLEFKAIVLEAVDGYVILDSSAFYPTSGGQLHDTGTLVGPTTIEVAEVFKQDHLIVHRVSGDLTGWVSGIEVSGHVDETRRRQLAQHHTSTHMINGVARKILGNHIWQAGAEKTEEKGRLDITHYKTLDADELDQIEREVNGIVTASIPVESMLLPRDEAENRFGFRLYQGGAVPGETLRVIRIDDLDTEACGGTHLRNTSEAGRITITGVKKIQDGILRLEYVAGARALEMYRSDLKDLTGLMNVMGIERSGAIREAGESIFTVWKKLRKYRSRARKIKDPERSAEARTELLGSISSSPALVYVERFKEMGKPDDGSIAGSGVIDADIARPHQHLSDISAVFSVQRTQLLRTYVRFMNDLVEWTQELDQ